MIEALILGTVLGLVSALSPGPFVAFVAATAMQHGLREGLKVALAPLGVEIPVLLASVLVLRQVSQGVLRWVGIVSGLVIAALGVHVLLRARGVRPPGDGTEEEENEEEGTRSLLGAVGAGLLSPAPWVFWTAVGGPLLLRSWRQGPAVGAAFLGGFFVFIVGGQMLVAFAASRGLHLLKEIWRRWVVRGMAVVVIAAGGILAWQSWVGNFTKLVRVEKEVQEKVR